MGSGKGKIRLRLQVSNTQCRIIAPPSILDEICEDFKIKVKGAFFSPLFRKRQWDGKKAWVSPSGYFKGGLLKSVLDYLKEKDYGVEVIDSREELEVGKIPKRVGHLVLRGMQRESVESLITNKVYDVPWSRGILHEATNAGKNLIAAAIHESYRDDGITCFIIHRELIYKQAIKEISELLGKEEVGYIGANGIKISSFNICMVKSLGNKLNTREVKDMLAISTRVIVDECHRAGTKEYEKVLNHLYNAPVKMGMSGTPDLQKDPNQKRAMTAFFGEILHVTKNKKMVELGYSTKPVIKVTLGETNLKLPGDYRGEYDLVITNNKKRHRLIWKRVRKQLDKDRYPLMIFCKHIQHAKNLKKSMPEDLQGIYKLGVIHSKVKDKAKDSILDKFKIGKIDILIATHLIAEGQNMPLIKYGINAGGSDSATTIVQWVGRMLRTHKSKKVVYIEDIFDTGAYLKRHSKHRVKYYKDQEFEVIERYKDQARKKSIKIY